MFFIFYLSYLFDVKAYLKQFDSKEELCFNFLRKKYKIADTPTTVFQLVEKEGHLLESICTSSLPCNNFSSPPGTIVWGNVFKQSSMHNYRNKKLIHSVSLHMYNFVVIIIVP